jgi:hypothetical protein
MSGEPGSQLGQISPDGLWRWDGTQWEAVAPGVSPPPAPRRSRSWIWWVAGGCALLLVLGLIGAGFGVYALVKRFQTGVFSCLPSDFPNYPGASVVSERANVGAGFAPGDINRCTMVLNSDDDVAAVTAFYEWRLDAGDWTIASRDSASGAIDFQRKSRPQTVGTLSVAGRGTHTEIDVRLDS